MRRALVVLACVGAFGSLSGSLHAQPMNRAAIIIRSQDGDITQKCVAFEEREITGAELLARSGIEVVQDANSLGTAVCSIQGGGCSADDCFCDYPTFWGYWTREKTSEEWAFSNNGATDRTVHNGTLDGWSWGRDGKPPPPKLAFDEVCAAGSTPVSSEVAAPSPAASSAPNYLAFAGFIVLFAGAATVAYLVRRRPRDRSGT